MNQKQNELKTTSLPDERLQQPDHKREGLALLFVCTGNTCRSPMAAALFNRYATDSGCRALSAGVAASDGFPASEQAVEVMRLQYGLDLAAHQSRAVTAGMVAQADLVLAMTEAHKQLLLRLFPQQKEKVATLAEAAGQSGQDVSDPFSGGYQQYARTAAELDVLVRKLVERFCVNTAAGE